MAQGAGVPARFAMDLLGSTARNEQWLCYRGEEKLKYFSACCAGWQPALPNSVRCWPFYRSNGTPRCRAV